LDEKLRVCREVALAMQADDRAEYEAEKISRLLTQVLEDQNQATKLMEHIRYRTGLLLERRPGVFAFAHLTFQEYLAARAVHEGNRLGLDAKRLVSEHTDGRWKEVIALYCGLTTTPAAIAVIQDLLNQPDNRSQALAGVLAEAYLSCGAEVAKDPELRKQVLERIARSPTFNYPGTLFRFPAAEVAPVANGELGGVALEDELSESFRWLQENPALLQEEVLLTRLKEWRDRTPSDVTELNYLLHRFGSNDTLLEISIETEMYASASMIMMEGSTQAELALTGLQGRQLGEAGVDASLLQALRVLARASQVSEYSINQFVRQTEVRLSSDTAAWEEMANLWRQVAAKEGIAQSSLVSRWVDRLDYAINEAASGKPAAKAKTTKGAKPTAKKTSRRKK
jgi:hypothetical protein